MIARALIFCLFPVSLLVAQPSPAPPKIGIVDFFGLRKADKDRVQKALEVKPGDPLPRSKGELELQLELVDQIVHANLEAVCCSDGKAILYVGILEKGAPTFQYREAPAAEDIKLPEAVVDNWNLFMEQLQVAVRTDKAAEDLTNGHSLMQYAPARELQEKFLPLVEKNLPQIKSVLRASADETERAIAAYVISYAPKKAEIVDDLQFAIQDPDDGVRNNAMRSLAALSVLAKLKPEAGIKISPTWFVEQMNSLVWSDRNKASFALVSLTDDRDEKVLALLKERALDSMTDMARWKHLPHALPGFILLARTAGWDETKIQETWKAGTHAAAVDEILKEFAKKKK